MAGINGFSAYQQINTKIDTRKADDKRVKNAGVSKTGIDEKNGIKENSSVKTSTWSSIKEGSSLIPKVGDYGVTIGDVKLSKEAEEYYDKLKAKYSNLQFIAVSSDVKAQVHQNAAAYGNANKPVVLIDDEKLERMATDESYRKKYEGLIAMAQTKLSDFKNEIMNSGANVKNFGMSVDSNGKESYFVSMEKTQNIQKEILDKKIEKKKEQKIKDKKKAEKGAAKERLEKTSEERKAKRKAELERLNNKEKSEEVDEETDVKTDDVFADKEYVTYESDSLDNLLSKIKNYSVNRSVSEVRTDAEKMVGTHIDFRQ